MNFNIFTTEQYLGFIRHLLTVAGGALVTKGILTDQVLNQLVGSLMTLIGFGWSLLTKTPAQVTIAQAKGPPPSK